MRAGTTPWRVRCSGRWRSVSTGSFGNLDESLLGDETLVVYAAAAGTTAAAPGRTPRPGTVAGPEKERPHLPVRSADDAPARRPTAR